MGLTQERLLDYRVRKVPNCKNDLGKDDAYNPDFGKVKYQLLFWVKWKGYDKESDNTWEPKHHLNDWTDAYDKDVRRIRSKHDRPSLKQLEAEIDEKNAKLAAEEKAQRKKERKAKRKEAERQDKLRKRRDEDNVDPPLVNISSDQDDSDSGRTQSGTPDPELIVQQSQHLQTLFTTDEEDDQADRSRPVGLPLALKQSNKLPKSTNSVAAAPSSAPRLKHKSHHKPKKKDKGKGKGKGKVEQIELSDSDNQASEGGDESSVKTVPSSEDEARPAPAPAKRPLARRTGAPPATQPKPPHKRPPSDDFPFATPDQIDGPGRKKTKPSSPARSAHSDGSNASAALGRAGPRPRALFAPADESDDEPDTKPQLKAQTTSATAPARLVSRSPPSEPEPDHSPPNSRPTSPQKKSSAPTSRPSPAQPAPPPPKAVDNSPIKLNREAVMSKVRGGELFKRRLPRGVESTEIKLVKWWAIDYKVVPLLDPARARVAGGQTVYIHAPQASTSLAQRLAGSKSAGQIRAKETEDDVHALELLLCQVANKIKLVRTMDGELDVVFVHANASEDDLAQLRSVRQMGVKEVAFYQFGENFTTKKRDNCKPLWTIAAAITFTPGAFVKNGREIVTLADRAQNRRQREVFFWAPATYAVKGGPLGKPARDDQLLPFDRSAAIGSLDQAVRNGQIGLTKSSPAAQQQGTLSSITTSFPAFSDKVKPDSAELNELGAKLSAAEAVPDAEGVVASVKGYAEAYDQIRRWIVVATGDEIKTGNSLLGNRPEIVFLEFEQVQRMFHSMLSDG